MEVLRGDSLASGALFVSADGSITRLITRIKAGDHAASQRIWEVYFQRMVALARSRLRSMPRRAADEEDVALCAFDSFVRRAARGQFPRLDDRDDLWRLLFLLTARKAINQARLEGRVARGAGRVRSLTDLDGLELDLILGKEPNPELAAQAADECRRLMQLLDDPSLRDVARWKMDGDTNAEIARRLGVIEKTVERKLRRIRQIWAEETPRERRPLDRSE
jgi:DNA-directed RNA polymerase specialized sigma24 family protein